MSGRRAHAWSANVDVEYDWKVLDDVTAFVGADVSYTGDSFSFWYAPGQSPAYNQYPTKYTQSLSANPYDIPGYSLVDLRAGVEKDDWKFQVWGRNVANTWYWNGASHVNDVLLHYTGMPTTYVFTLSYKYH